MQTNPNAETVNATPGVEKSDNGQTAGDILRQERRRLGLNEKEVADQLHITMHYVKALESNSYEKLPGAVFAKGYLKSYALLLGLDVDDLLSRYNEISSQQKAVMEETSRLVKARRKKDRNKPLVIVSLLVFIGGFLALWLVNSYFGEGPVSDAPTTVETNASAHTIRPALYPQVEPQVTTQAQLTFRTEPAEPTPSTKEQMTNRASVSESLVGQPDLVKVDEGAILVRESQRADGESISDLQDIGGVLAAVEFTAQSGEAASATDQSRVLAIEAMGNDVLLITFTGESWVEVNDSESQQIYRNIREAGDVLEITGSAPFNILVGDAVFTRISLNGNEIDLTPDIRIDNSARLTVGL